MSISTKKGDHGFTALPGHLRVSKADLRIEIYGAIDELISAIGFARSLCEDAEIAARYKEVQRELFLLTGAVAPSVEEPVDFPDALVERLTGDVQRFEKLEGILSDWSVPGELTLTAAIDVARSVCRRTERICVRARQSDVALPDSILAYLNRLSDLLWISGRAIELQSGRDSTLREQSGKRWSRAW